MTLQEVLEDLKPGEMIRRQVGWTNQVFYLVLAEDKTLRIMATAVFASSDKGLKIEDLMAKDWYVVERVPTKDVTAKEPSRFFVGEEIYLKHGDKFYKEIKTDNVPGYGYKIL